MLDASTVLASVTIPTKSSSEYFLTALPDIVTSSKVADDQSVLQLSTVISV